MGQSITNTLVEIWSDDPYVPSNKPTSNELELLNELHHHLQEQVDEERDRNLFQKLWNAVGAGVSGDEMQYDSEQWREKLGFQRSNCLSDIRGGGRLAVLALRYLATSSRGKTLLAKAQGRRERVLREGNERQQNDSFDSYPFAPAVINVVRLLAERFNIVGPHGLPPKIPLADNPSSNYPALRTTDDFFTLVIDIMYVVDDQFEIVGGGYMAFPEVMARVDRIVDSIIRTKAAERLYPETYLG